MWEIYEHRRVERQLKRLPVDILKRYEKWKDVVSISGPQGLRLIRGFNDEVLSGEWSGFRSSRLNQQFRVIYRVQRQEVRIDVVSVNPHDYRRK